MRYILLTLSFSFIHSTYASLKDDIVPGWVSITSQDASLTSIFTYVRDSIFSLLALVAIWVFLFIGAKLVVARWNPEEFKKALKMFIYAIVGLFVITVAYAAVRMVAWLNF